MVPQILKNRPQDGPKWVSEESRSKKQEKCKNEQPFIVFGTFLLSAGVENQKKIVLSGVENEIKLSAILKSNFGGFGRILEPSWDPKSSKNARKTRSKNTDF